MLDRNPPGLVYQPLTPRVCLPSGDELLLTEMIFNGLFNDLTVEQATALLSCFVFQENVSARRRPPPPELPKQTDKDSDSTRRSGNRPFRFSRFPSVSHHQHKPWGARVLLQANARLLFTCERAY